MTCFGEEAFLSVRLQWSVQDFDGSPRVEVLVLAQENVSEHTPTKQVAYVIIPQLLIHMLRHGRSSHMHSVILSEAKDLVDPRAVPWSFLPLFRWTTDVLQ